jgi:uncharacterized protein YjiS (DUF1127 family)
VNTTAPQEHDKHRTKEKIMSTYANQDVGETAAPSILGTGLAVLRDQWRAFREWRAQQQTIALLHSMNDRDLKDIGLTRAEIEPAVRGQSMRDRIIRYY